MLEAPQGFYAEEPPFGLYANTTRLALELDRFESLSLRAMTARLDGLDRLAEDTVWRLNCIDQKVTDASLDHVARLATLEVLCLTRTDVTDAGMHALARMPKLHHLTLDDCDISDVGLATIAVIESLEELELYGTHVTGTGLKALTRHPSLRVLDLRHTKVHDGLEPLLTIPNLRQVRLSWWAERHADCLREQRPEVEII